jgi:hypothetical protein
MARATKILTEEEKDALLAMGTVYVEATEQFTAWLQPRRPLAAAVINFALRWVKGFLEREGA